MRYHLVLLLFLCCWPKPSPAHPWFGPENTPPVAPAGYFSFSPLARSIYQNILSLRFAEVREALPTLRRQEPANLIALYLENTLEVLQILVDDDQASYERWSGGMNARLSRVARGDARSPYFLFVQAEIRLQWAALRLRHGDYWSGLSNLKQGYGLLLENQRRHPAFRANWKSLGILHALVGNIPGEYKWAVQWLSGMHGTVEQGLSELNSVLDYAKQHDFEWEAETRIACAFLQLHLANDQHAAWQTLTSGKRLDAQTSPLAAFALANMAIRTARNDEAIRLLEHCPQSAPFHPFPYRDYLLGIAKLNRLDPDAGQPLERFVQQFKGQNGIKEACQKLAWHQLLAGRPEQYRHYMALARSKGVARTEPDKAALREARSGEWPDVQLLRARLLFDGGYYGRAYALLSNAATTYARAGKPELEYHYRMGRITHAMGRLPEAIRYYTFAIETGARQPWFFACNAALQLGLLHEQRQEKALARAAFRRCLELQPEEYAAGLHARAKAGLERVR